jgi:hypothetical protein
LFAALPLALLSSASAATSLNFVIPGQTAPYQEILNYYNGGASQEGQIGPNYGISFGPNAIALQNYPLTQVGNEPGGGNALAFLTSSETMNVAAGFSSGFSFYYTAPLSNGVVSVYSGLNDTGTLLATIPLTITPAGTNGFPFAIWDPAGATFAGTAESVNFSGFEGDFGFSDVTLGSATPLVNSVPDNTGMIIYGIAAVGLAIAARPARKVALVKI